MRRKDREVTDNTARRAIMDNAAWMTLSLADKDGPYGVPLSFALVDSGALAAADAEAGSARGSVVSDEGAFGLVHEALATDEGKAGLVGEAVAAGEGGACGAPCIVFHTALAGRKRALLDAEPRCHCIFMGAAATRDPGPDCPGCSIGVAYASVFVEGIVERVTDPARCALIAAALVQRYGGPGRQVREEEMTRIVCYCVHPVAWSGKSSITA